MDIFVPIAITNDNETTLGFVFILQNVAMCLVILSSRILRVCWKPGNEYSKNACKLKRHASFLAKLMKKHNNNDE